MPTKQENSATMNHRTGQTCDFEQINDPGLYVDRNNGLLFRVPEDALISGRSPAIEICSKTPCIVTKISDNPFLATTKARMVAADMDLPVAF
jgi:hypothetical protein